MSRLRSPGVQRSLPWQCAGRFGGSAVQLPISARLRCHGEGRSGNGVSDYLLVSQGDYWCVSWPLFGNRVGGLSLWVVWMQKAAWWQEWGCAPG